MNALGQRILYGFIFIALMFGILALASIERRNIIQSVPPLRFDDRSNPCQCEPIKNYPKVHHNLLKRT